jgi:hypothetical protein
MWVAMIGISRLIAALFFDARMLKVAAMYRERDVARWVLRGFWFQKVLRFNWRVPWPVHPTTQISDPINIVFEPEDLGNFQSPGCYFQAFAARIVLKKGVRIAPNVGLITANHQPGSLEEHQAGQDIVIGERSWIGMNAVILPGVTLGPDTIVGAGTVVTRSFPEGGVVLTGVAGTVRRRIGAGRDE